VALQTTRRSVETERMTATPQSEAVAGALTLVNARLIDGSGAPPRTGVTVAVEDGKIASVGEEPPAPTASALDLEGRTLLPGLIDAHVHLSSLGLPDVADDLQAYGLALVARRMVEAGFTTVRDLGSYGDSLFRLRRAIGLGLCPGPRLVLCGQIVAATSPGARAFPGMYCEADGPDGMRRAVREQIRQGVDFIKVMSTGALTVADEDVHPAQLTAEELSAVVDESHRTGFVVASHAEGLAGIRLSVEAGVDTLEHGEMAFEDPGVLAAMAEQGIVLVPTLCVFDLVADGDGFPGWMRERAKFLRASAEKTVAAARGEGVAMAAGADAGPHGENARELVRMVETGLRPMEAIVAATSTAARACRLEDELGTIEPGKTADLLVLDGDPLEDVRLFLDPGRRWLVLQEGSPVAGAEAGTAS
jgi:imidazolonepropionase-like amidohydrolase